MTINESNDSSIKGEHSIRKDSTTCNSTVQECLALQIKDRGEKQSFGNLTCCTAVHTHGKQLSWEGSISPSHLYPLLYIMKINNTPFMFFSHTFLGI